MPQTSKFLRHESCPECNSSDALAIYSDGGQHCFGAGCDYHVHGGDQGMTSELPKAKPLNFKGVVSSIPQRRISQDTCGRYGVTVEYTSTGEIDKHYYPYYDLSTGDLCAAKVREVKTKGFMSMGDVSNVGFFGQQQCNRDTYITITEGELDALAIYEMSGKQWDVVSLRSGASNAAKEIKAQLEWLEGYDTVVLCFDNDKAGEEAVEQVKDLFSPDKLKIYGYPLKDASDMLMANRSRTLRNTGGMRRSTDPTVSSPVLTHGTSW